MTPAVTKPVAAPSNDSVGTALDDPELRDSMVKHALGQSAYRERTEQCAAAVRAIGVRYPDTRSLRDVDAEMLETMWAELPAIPARRARHVVGENRRVEDFVSACGRGDLRRMGELFAASHASLRDDYEVSCGTRFSGGSGRLNRRRLGSADDLGRLRRVHRQSGRSRGGASFSRRDCAQV